MLRADQRRHMVDMTEQCLVDNSPFLQTTGPKPTTPITPPEAAQALICSSGTLRAVIFDDPGRWRG